MINDGGVVVHLVIVTVLALASATCYGASYVIEQRKASQAPEETSMRLSLIWHLARQPMWWVAIAVDIGGYGFQAWAIGLGDLVFVQPILVLSLPISLVIGHWAGSHRLERRDLVWSLLLVAALSTFLAAFVPGSGLSRPSTRSWMLPLAVVAGAVVGSVVIARRLSPPRRALLLGVASGLLFGVSSALTKPVTALLGDVGLRTVTHWETIVFVIVVALSVLTMSSAFQAHDLRAALPAIEVVQPMVAIALGLGIFNERLHLGNPLVIVAVIASIVVMIVATISLARSAAPVEPSEEAEQLTVHP